MQNDATNNSVVPTDATVETAAAASDVSESIPAPATPEPAIPPAPSVVESNEKPSSHATPPKPHPTGASASNPEPASPSEPETPEDSLRLRYEILLTAGREQVLRVKSMIEFPMALDLENLAQTDVNFPEVLDRILIQPVTTKFRAYLQKRFEVASRIAAEKEAAAKPPPPPVQPSFTIPKPAIRTDVVLPEMKATPPPPRMPGGCGQSFPNNGS